MNAVAGSFCRAARGNQAPLTSGTDRLPLAATRPVIPLPTDSGSADRLGRAEGASMYNSSEPSSIRVTELQEPHGSTPVRSPADGAHPDCRARRGLAHVEQRRQLQPRLEVKPFGIVADRTICKAPQQKKRPAHWERASVDRLTHRRFDVRWDGIGPTGK
jgi:hypothetical protein